MVIDENYYGDYGAKTRPAAKLLMFLPEIATAAATRMFRRLSEPEYLPSEVVFKPEIVEALKHESCGASESRT